MSKMSKLQNWLNNEIEKDKKDLDKEKLSLIKELKSTKKEELFKKKKLSFWDRIKKVFFEK